MVQGMVLLWMPPGTDFMASVTLKGTKSPLLQRTEQDFDPSRGIINRILYRGSDQSQMVALGNTYVAAGIACRIIYEQGDSATLEIEDSTLANTIDNWQLVGNSEARDVWSHPTNIGLLNEDQIAAIRFHLNAQDSGTVTFGTAPPTNVADLRGFSGTAVERFYTLALRGGTEYRRGQYVLRHTTNVSNRWGVNVADFGVDMIYTPAKLISEISNSGFWVFPAPFRLQYKISNIPAPTAQPNFLWGWLKSSSTETTSAHNRVEIATEYTLDQWSTDNYLIY